MTEQYDAIVVGSGAGGAAVAYKMVQAGRRVLVLEKGDHLPRDGTTLDTKKVFREGVFKNKEPWVDGENKVFIPGEFYNVGGKTKWYGAALLRFAPHEFEADEAHQCLGWPFSYDALATYYDEAERLLDVHTFENEPELQALLDRIVSGDSAWKPETLPLGLKMEIVNHEEEAKHFDGFASACGYKSDAEWNLLDRVADSPNLTLLTGKEVMGLLPDGGEAEIIAGVRCKDGSTYRANAVVLAAAPFSARLTQQSLQPSTSPGKT